MVKLNEGDVIWIDCEIDYERHWCYWRTCCCGYRCKREVESLEYWLSCDPFERSPYPFRCQKCGKWYRLISVDFQSEVKQVCCVRWKSKNERESEEWKRERSRFEY